ncbi:hypothetical protein [Nitrosovibrio sp. Nv4]|uniref:hypothetical protein n=1 Tax=Nitrosovibrio sp. Nv4 TaxID=1945880 RepID=UPI001180FB58|nr:hypothetical protein [Nitrosovibrio sp. Nv4]
MSSKVGMIGLAQGISAGVGLSKQLGQMDLDKQYAGRLQNADATAEEQHAWKKEDRENALKSLGGFADMVDGMSTPSFRTDGSGQPMNISAPQQSMALKPLTERPNYGMQRMRGFAEGGLVQATDNVFAGRRAPSNVGGLSDLQQVQSQAQPEQPQQAQENLSPTERITRAMMETDLLSNPDKLSKMHAYAEMNGFGDKIKPFLERAYIAKKNGLIEGGMFLARGQVDEAIQALAKGGIKLQDRPEQVDPSDRTKWKININGAGEQVHDIRELLSTTLDVEKYLKYGMDKNESEGKRNVSDSSVRDNDASVRVRNAQVGKLGEEMKSIREERNSGALDGSTGRISKLPAPVATAEWLVENGVYDNHKDEFNAVKTLHDESPAAQRMALIEAGMKSGMSPAEAAKDVDAFLAQS